MMTEIGRKIQKIFLFVKIFVICISMQFLFINVGERFKYTQFKNKYNNTCTIIIHILIDMEYMIELIQLKNYVLEM